MSYLDYLVKFKRTKNDIFLPIESCRLLGRMIMCGERSMNVILIHDGKFYDMNVKEFDIVRSVCRSYFYTMEDFIEYVLTKKETYVCDQ